MSEWWTYTLSDFLLFSPRTYYRLLARHNAALWPGHLLVAALGLGLLAVLRRPRPWHGRAVSAVLALLWAWVGWSFVGTRYAAINWAAGPFAWVFAGEALLFAWIGAARGALTFRTGGSRIGLALFAGSVVIYPMLAPLLGRGAGAAELFGIMPDPTAVGTVGLLLLASGRGRGALLIAPVLWCIVTDLTLLAMGSPEAALPPLAVVTALGAWWRRGRRREEAVA